MSPRQVIDADWTWTGRAFESGVQVEVGADGRIARVGRLGLPPTRRLAGRALLPGLVNAHSHAFQRGLRGHGERFPEGGGSFWTWREAMYGLVERLDAALLRRLSLAAFREMLTAGITTVGEFHYVHHAAGRADFALDEVVLDAAAAAGIRIVLLNAYYRTGGIAQPLAGAQVRFDALSPAAYWEQMDRLTSRLDPATQTLGAVVHSVRAAVPGEIATLYGEAARRGVVFHMHVEEQRREIEECRAAYGRRPLALLCDTLPIDDRFTAVHCTHAAPEDLTRFLAAGGGVCTCPLTEANLGDGLPDVTPVHAAGGRLSLGTDSNARIAMVEELRWLEYGQRLRAEARGVLADEDGSVARTLLAAATTGGARALGVDVGQIAPGAWADFAAVDLAAPELAGTGPEELLDALVFGGGDRTITAVAVGGRWLDPTGDAPRGPPARA